MDIALARIELCFAEKMSFSALSNCDFESENPYVVGEVGKQLVKFTHVNNLISPEYKWAVNKQLVNYHISRHINLGKKLSRRGTF